MVGKQSGAPFAIAAVAALATASLLGGRGSRKLEGWERIGPMPTGASLHRVSRGLYSPRVDNCRAQW